MYNSDYESSWQAASGSVEIMKKVLFLISIIIFLFIAAITLSILQKANVNIESCEMIAEKSAYYEHETKIRTRIAAEKILWDVVGPVEFTGDSLEVCGVTFRFKGDDGTRYMFCENGKLYRATKECNSLL